MKKNLIVLHLESLSNCLLNIYQDELPSLREIMAKSMRFKNFFTSATSSVMAVCDFFHGNSFEMDHFTIFDDMINKVSGKEKNLFLLLQEVGYQVKGIGYPVPRKDDFTKFHIWNPGLEAFRWIRSEEDFFKTISSDLGKSRDHPFALYIYDIRSHFCNRDPYNQGATDGFEAIRIGYSRIDRTINHLWRTLEKNHLLDETIVVGFGDHGDELWTHSFSGGFCHANEPYSNIIHTPAFIYDSNQGARDMDQMASMIDLKKTCLGLLGIEHTNDFEYGGIDLFKDEKTIVYCQNLFTNQKPSSILNKAYSATNDKYHLIVSNLGLEMYAYKLDITNHCNLLDHFTIDREGELHFRPRGGLLCSVSHFPRIMTKKQIEEIVSNYNILRAALKKWVLLKNAIVNAEDGFLFDVRKFYSIRASKYYWRQPRYTSWPYAKFWLMVRARACLPERVKKLLRPIRDRIRKRKY